MTVPVEPCGQAAVEYSVVGLHVGVGVVLTPQLEQEQDGLTDPSAQITLPDVLHEFVMPPWDEQQPGQAALDSVGQKPRANIAMPATAALRRVDLSISTPRSFCPLWT